MFQSKPRIWVRVLFGLLALVLIVGGGIMLFRLGYSRGALTTGREVFEFGEMPHMWNYHPSMRFHYFPFGSFIFGFFFLLLIFALLRRAFWGPRWGMYGHGGRFSRMEEMHAELHKRMDTEQGKAEGSPADDTPEDQPTEEA